MIALDTSVVVALFADWHEGHAAAVAAVSGEKDVRLPEQVALETYSVLTRLPPPHRVHPSPVATFLTRRFDAPWLRLDARAYKRFVREVCELELFGGSVYDALVGATARDAGVVLMSRDHRAARVYVAMGVDYRLLE